MIKAEEQQVRNRAKVFRFDPFDEELISDFLKPKIMGKELPCDVVKDREVYGPCCNPWRVFDPNDQSSWLRSPHVKTTEKFMYVFAKLSKISSSRGSKNTSKKAGCGTWVGKTTRVQIEDDEGNVIGEKRYLVFEINEIGSEETGVGFYSMHEYSLSGINEGLDFADTIVLCRITYDSAKKTTISRKLGTKVSDRVSTTSKQVLIKEECDSKNLEGTGSVCAENLTVLDKGVGDWCATIQLNNGVQESDDFGGGFTLDDLGGVQGSDDFGGGFSLDGLGGVQGSDDLGVQESDDYGRDFYLNSQDECDPDWITACLNSDQEEEPFQDNTINLGKRTFESENSNQTKKICLGIYY